MDENEYNDALWLLALFALMANQPQMPEPLPCCVSLSESVGIDEFTLEQLKAATTSRMEAEKHKTDILRDAYNAELENEAGYQSLYGHGEDT